MDWMVSKEEAAELYRKRQFLPALSKYEEAADILESLEEEETRNEELAKIFSNISLMNQIMFDKSHDTNFVQAAVNAALKSIQQDGNWSKGHLRMSQAKLRLNEQDGAVASMIDFMKLASDKESQSPAVLDHLRALKYYTHLTVMHQSPSWHLLDSLKMFATWIKMGQDILLA